MIDQRIIDGFDRESPFKLSDGKLIGLFRIGSHSHGTHIPSTDENSIDDVDYMGIVLPPPSFTFGVNGLDKRWKSTVFKFEELDCVFYSLQHFVALLLKGNPNVLGLLWLNAKDVVFKTKMWDTLKRNRHIFVSKRSYEAFRGTAKAHFEGMKGDGAYKGYMGEKRKKIVNTFGYDVKDAAHMLRILRMGIEFFETGDVNVDRTGRDSVLLKQIKRGEYTLEQVKGMWTRLDQLLKESFETTTLPDTPDVNIADELLQRATIAGYGLDKMDLSY